MIKYPTQSFRNIIIIGTVDEYGEMDPDKYIPWIDTEDMEFFRNETLGHCVVMDHFVWHSLKTKPLDGRLNIVICDDDSIKPSDEYVVVKNFNEAMWAIWHYTVAHEKIYIIGGLKVYNAFMPLARRILLTKVKTPYKSGMAFPDIYNSKKRAKNTKRTSLEHDPRSILQDMRQKGNGWKQLCGKNHVGACDDLCRKTS